MADYEGVDMTQPNGLLGDDDLYPTGHEIELPLPYDVALRLMGAELTESGRFVFPQPDAAMPAVTLRVGEYDAGQWLPMTIALQGNGRWAEPEYLLTLRRVKKA